MRITKVEYNSMIGVYEVEIDRKFTVLATEALLEDKRQLFARIIATKAEMQSAKINRLKKEEKLKDFKKLEGTEVN